MHAYSVKVALTTLEYFLSYHFHLVKAQLSANQVHPCAPECLELAVDK